MISFIGNRLKFDRKNFPKLPWIPLKCSQKYFFLQEIPNLLLICPFKNSKFPSGYNLLEINKVFAVSTYLVTTSGFTHPFIGNKFDKFLFTQFQYDEKLIFAV